MPHKIMAKGVFMNMKTDSIRSFIPALPNPRFEPIIELTSNREAVIEGCLGIVEYSDCIATVNCKYFLISFEGFGICLNTLSKDCISVTGSFTKISFSEL